MSTPCCDLLAELQHMKVSKILVTVCLERVHASMQELWTASGSTGLSHGMSALVF